MIILKLLQDKKHNSIYFHCSFHIINITIYLQYLPSRCILFTASIQLLYISKFVQLLYFI